jgi:hypothetical protein
MSNLKSVYLKPINILIITLLTLTIFPQEVLAKKVNNVEAVGRLTTCILSDDATEEPQKDGTYACCSKKEKFCIWCPVSADKPCVVKPTSITTPGETPPFITIINPAFFNELTEDASPDNNTSSPLRNFILRSNARSVEK